MLGNIILKRSRNSCIIPVLMQEHVGQAMHWNLTSATRSQVTLHSTHICEILQLTLKDTRYDCFLHLLLLWLYNRISAFPVNKSESLNTAKSGFWYFWFKPESEIPIQQNISNDELGVVAIQWGATTMLLPYWIFKNARNLLYSNLWFRLKSEVPKTRFCCVETRLSDLFTGKALIRL